MLPFMPVGKCMHASRLLSSQEPSLERDDNALGNSESCHQTRPNLAQAFFQTFQTLMLPCVHKQELAELLLEKNAALP